MLATILDGARRQAARYRWELALGSIGVMLATAPTAAAVPVDVVRDASCCNVIELRQYTLYPGAREGFVELFDGTYADSLDATGMTVIGQFRDLDRPNYFVWMRGFQNMEARARELSGFYDGDLWHATRSRANSSMRDSDNVLLLVPASPDSRFHEVPRRAATVAAAPGKGLIVVTLYYTAPDALHSFATLFQKTLRHRLEAAGAKILAGYVSSAEANNFPRLPIRTGEHIYLSVAQFRSVAAYETVQQRLATDAGWSKRLWPEAREQLSRDPEVLRLSPTSRSRLHG